MRDELACYVANNGTQAQAKNQVPLESVLKISKHLVQGSYTLCTLEIVHPTSANRTELNIKTVIIMKTVRIIIISIMNMNFPPSRRAVDSKGASLQPQELSLPLKTGVTIPRQCQKQQGSNFRYHSRMQTQSQMSAPGLDARTTITTIKQKITIGDCSHHLRNSLSRLRVRRCASCLAFLTRAGPSSSLTRWKSDLRRARFDVACEDFAKLHAMHRTCKWNQTIFFNTHDTFDGDCSGDSRSVMKQ